MSDAPKLTFAKAYAELEEITQEFESRELDLEKSIPRFKRATELVAFLKKELSKMENQIEAINLDAVPQEQS